MISTVYVPEIGQYRATDTEHPWRSCWAQTADDAYNMCANFDRINREMFGVDET